MSRRIVSAALAVAVTAGATLMLANPVARAAKPGAQPAPNPCVGAQSRAFPAMVFTRKRTTGGHVYYDTLLSDRSGECQQTVFVADGFAPTRVGSDVNLRYLQVTPATGAGLVLRGDGAAGIAMSRFSVSFDASGVPSVSSGAYASILSLAELQVPADLVGWQPIVIANPLVSPDESRLLVTVVFQQLQGTTELLKNTHWVCPFEVAQALPVVAAQCRRIYGDRSVGEVSTAGWGGLGDTVYLTDVASGGSARSLYRMSLADQSISEIWSLGTWFRDAKAQQVAGRELVAVHEAGGASGCTRIRVIDAGTCTANGCQVVNGDGSPALTMAWLPDGRVVGEGRTAPNRKGQCSPSGAIVTFDPEDTNGTATTVTPAGSQPDGAGGG